MNAIVLCIDRLHAGYLGAYGNAWVETPAVDRLAFEGFVFDQCLADSPRLDSLYRAYWQGRHAMEPDEAAEPRPSLPERLGGSGVATTLVTDEPGVAAHPLAGRFGSVVELEPPEEAEPAQEVEATHLARCLVKLMEWLERADGPLLVWCHLTGLGGPWDAPLDFRMKYVGEGDPDPPTTAEVPGRMLPEDFDPDELLGITQAYAGQVALVDACLGAFWEFLDASPAGRDSLLVLASPRGFPLGEHRGVGDCDGALYGELVHVPLVVRLPDRTGQAGRSQALVQPADLWATLLDWFNVGDASPGATGSLLPLMREEAAEIRDRVCLSHGDQRAIRTPAWYLRQAGGLELFRKPDDRWEINDVADRCPQVVEPLLAALADYELAIRAGQLSELPPLDDVLRFGLE